MSEEAQQKHHFVFGRLAFLMIGLLLGVLGLLIIRFATYAPESVHYHANFAVYIDGKRETFKDPTYYEEVKVCDLHGTTPQSRVHMHDEEAGVVHVHDKAVTWGDFFNNLGWQIGPDFIHSKDTLYAASDTDKLNVMLNGQDLTGITDISNEVINDKDRLLVSYGPSDPAVLEKEYSSVPNNAAKVDTQNDPASCAGSEGPTFADRLHHLL
jgi:hypothetical protein